MLVLTRRIGEAIRIGDDIRLNVHARLRHHITLGVTVPGPTELLVEDTAMTPRVLPGGQRFYLIPLLTGESVRIGEIEVRIGFDTAWASGRQVRLAITAPRSVPVHREEIYLRDHAPDRMSPTRILAGWASWLKPHTLGHAG